MSDVRAFIFGAPLSRAESLRLRAKNGTARRSRTGRRQPVRVVLNSGRASRIEHVSPWADLTTVVDVTTRCLFRIGSVNPESRVRSRRRARVRSENRAPSSRVGSRFFKVREPRNRPGSPFIAYTRAAIHYGVYW